MIVLCAHLHVNLIYHAFLFSELHLHDSKWLGCRFKRLTGRHEAQIYESDYKYFAARAKQRRVPQHTLSSVTILQVS